MTDSLQGAYNGWLVAFSIAVAVLASYTALSMAGRVHRGGRSAAGWWIAGGAFAMGTGIWSMHFVGMLAFRLPIPMGYDPAITFVSWLLPVTVSALALWQVSRDSPTWRQLGASAVLLGIGINAMHYVGMAAMRMDPGIVWDPALVALSLAIAIGAAAAALWIAFQLRDADSRAWRRRGLAALLMGAAIVGMHYTGMAAADFPAGSVCRAATGGTSLTPLAVLVIVATAAILAIALVTSVYDARLEARAQVLDLVERTSAERQRLLEQERAARLEAERLGELKDQFLATLSHELRTPLNAIVGWVQLLQLKSDPEHVAKGLQTIERNARLQAQLIDDLLDMSRITAGKVRLEPQWLDLCQLAEAAIETARPAAFAKHIELEGPCEPGLPMVRGDAARLQQVLWNLLSNAIKFTPEGGRVQVAVTRRGQAVALSVTDTGCGIPADFLDQVFDPFRQVDGSTTRRHGGLGLGLAIVRQLVALHGGSVQAESAGPGHGARFTVVLPAGESAVNPPGSRHLLEPPLSAQGLASHGLEGVRVLVVEDDDDARHLVEQLLTRCGMQVTLASSAAEALALLADGPTDLLVSDIAMPGMDGFELVRRIRQMEAGTQAGSGTRLPAVALSAFSDADAQAQAAEAGFDRLVPKPLDARRLLATLVELR